MAKSEIERVHILSLLAKGNSVKEAAAAANVHETTVRRLKKHVEEKGQIAHCKSPGRPKKVSQRGVYVLVRTAKKNMTSSLSEIVNESQLNISDVTGSRTSCSSSS